MQPMIDLQKDFNRELRRHRAKQYIAIFAALCGLATLAMAVGMFVAAIGEWTGIGIFSAPLIISILAFGIWGLHFLLTRH
jgi:hypothetical protein